MRILQLVTRLLQEVGDSLSTSDNPSVVVLTNYPDGSNHRCDIRSITYDDEFDSIIIHLHK